MWNINISYIFLKVLKEDADLICYKLGRLSLIAIKDMMLSQENRENNYKKWGKVKRVRLLVLIGNYWRKIESSILVSSSKGSNICSSISYADSWQTLSNINYLGCTLNTIELILPKYHKAKRASFSMPVHAIITYYSL